MKLGDVFIIDGKEYVADCQYLGYKNVEDAISQNEYVIVDSIHNKVMGLTNKQYLDTKN